MDKLNATELSSDHGQKILERTIKGMVRQHLERVIIKVNVDSRRNVFHQISKSGVCFFCHSEMTFDNSLTVVFFFLGNSYGQNSDKGAAKAQRDIR